MRKEKTEGKASRHPLVLDTQGSLVYNVQAPVKNGCLAISLIYPSKHNVTPERKERNSMIFNVAQLMKANVGTSLEAEFDEDETQFDDEDGLKIIGPVVGHARMRRINQGLLVDGWVDITLELSCTRCLKIFEQPMHVSIEERFQPTLDIITGMPLPPIEEDDVFPIDDHHQIDLTEAFRQQILLDIPMVTLCQEDCKGLCAQCGKDLNLGPCNCEPEVDPRMSVLKTLLLQQEEEALHETHE